MAYGNDQALGLPDWYPTGDWQYHLALPEKWISGGGTLFQDITSKKSIWYYLGIVRLAQLMGKKVCIAYQGIGPLNTKLYRKMAKKILNRKFSRRYYYYEQNN